MAVGKFHLPITSSSGGNLEPTPYVRPSDWLPIDHLVNVGDQKFVGLIAVNEEGNWVTVQCRGDFTVNWGDGTITNHTSNSIANYQHNYASFPGTESSRGYRQAIVTVTPQAGQNLTQLYLHQRHPGIGVNYTNRWLDIKMSAPNMTGMLISSGNILNCRMLEQFDYVGTNNLTSLNSVFANCLKLQKIKNLYTQTIVGLNNTFSNCYSLEEVDFLQTPNVVDFQSTFNGCYVLKRISNLDLSKGTNFTSMFNSCISIVEFPALNCFMGTTFINMFSSCYSMLKTPTITTDINKTKVFTNMFQNCFSLEEFVDFETRRATSYNTMFQNCYNLRVLPTIFKTNTVVSYITNAMFNGCTSLERTPEMDLTTCTNTNAMFANCLNLEYVYPFTLGSTNITGMLQGCHNLKEIPVFTFLSGPGTIIMNSTVAGCFNLVHYPNWDMSKASDITNFGNSILATLTCPAYDLSNVNVASNFGGGGAFLNNSSLYKVDCFGMRYAISFANCQLSRTELVKIFNNLGTAVGVQTITISGNYGASSLTAPERAIATGKGWTIIG